MKKCTAGLVLTIALSGQHAVCAEDSRPSGAPANWPKPVPDEALYSMVLIDRLEAGFSNDEDTNTWDAQGWWGGDYNKLWIKTEGEGEQGKTPESLELQTLYSRTIAPFWNAQIGLRHDFRPKDNERTHLAVGIQGLAPYRFELDNALFVSDEGDVTARIEAEYEVMFTQRLILQPRLELNAAAQPVKELGIGSGINNTEMGLRLRYEIRREFAPYVGVSWTRFYGETADLKEAEGTDNSTVYFVAGIRAWF
ncbi:MAG TPA: copper resistance protein B [Gammaproteobacteria bacterium]|nr:copper resistance protein B [Gammaproteobacteria bacterium]